MIKLRIKDIREDNDKTQQQVATYLCCDRSLYSKYERCERDIPLALIAKLATYYGTSIDYLVGYTDEKMPYRKSKNNCQDYNTR